MKPKINMIGIITSQFEPMVNFYKEVMDFKIKLQMEQYAEFESEGVRFAISTSTVMQEATGEKAYTQKKSGHSFELAFEADSIADVDSSYKNLINKGAKAIKEPANMPWNQRTAFFADPDGNIHEIFTNL